MRKRIFTMGIAANFSSSLQIICFRLSILLLVATTSCKEENKLFKSLSPAKTNIHFSNVISENDTFNILKYEYTYNGGGVGIADFDQNGYPDVFFSGNMVENQLYLNQGQFQFRDISAEAAITGQGRWSSGVAIVDINADGWQDIYVCATAYRPGHRRANQLYVNQGVDKEGIPTFKEMGAAYGIADTSHTIHAAFFDYDNDGDLDLFLAVNQMDQRHTPNQYRNKITDGTSIRNDKLFRNDFDETKGHAVFTDVSIEAGILIEGFSLGVNIVDINEDGWKDIYITNDYLSNDLFYINNGDGTFTDQAATYFKHTSHSAMGNDVVDLNNDGMPEVIALDMLPEDNLRRKTMLPPNNYTNYLNNERYGYQYQYVRNTLQLNQGTSPNSSNPIFSEIALLAGVSSTDWSWTPLVGDFDNDRDRDLIVTNGFPKDVTDRDFVDYNNEYSRFMSEDKLLAKIPSVKIKNYAFENQLASAGEVPRFEKVSEKWGIDQVSFSNGAAYADIDLDGDLDYIVNNIDDSAFVYQNLLAEQAEKTSNWIKIKFKGADQNPSGLGAQVRIYDQLGMQTWEHTPYRGYLSSVEQGLHFGLGESDMIDSLVVRWPNGLSETLLKVKANQTIELDINNASSSQLLQLAQRDAPPLLDDITDEVGIDFLHPETDFIDFNVQRLLLHKLSQYGPALAVADVNQDGLDDFFIGGSHFHKGRFGIQQTDGSFSIEDLLPGEEGEAKQEEDLGALFFDADNDGDEDLYIVSGGSEFKKENPDYQDRLYFNEDGEFIHAKDALPSFISSGSCVKAADMDRDGDLDLFIGGRLIPDEYPKAATSYLLRNDGKGNFEIANNEIASTLQNVGMVCDALWTDYDQDGWVDLMLAGEWMPLQILKNEQGKLSKPTPIGENLSGWWNSLLAADFDQDGDIDYIAGNLGKNTLLQASPQLPLRVYAADFDGNDTYDFFPTAWFPDVENKLQEFPFFGRVDMEKQLIKLRGFYTRHFQFGTASMQEMLANFPEIDPLVLEAQQLASVYIENQGNGKFEVYALPIEAQLAPIYGMLAEDVNDDGQLDLLLTGNDYGTEVGMGRYDALNGLVLLGDTSNTFRPLSADASGLYISGDGKSMVRLEGRGAQPIVLASQNRGKLKFFRPNRREVKPLRLQPLDCKAIIHLQNGDSFVQELAYGQSYLSQSSRKIWLPFNVSSIELIDFRGQKRTVDDF